MIQDFCLLMISRLLPRILPLALLLLLLSNCDMREFGGDDAELEVTVETEGDLVDENGYVLLLNEEDERAVAPNDVAVFVGLPPGEYVLELTDLAPNCIVTDGVERAITLSAGQAATVSFSVVCADVDANLVFESDRGGSLDIYTLDFATGIVRPVTSSPGPDYEPSVSPDGRWIYFTSRREGNLEIYRIRPDGTGLGNLTNSPSAEFEPAVSPDGSRIAFTSNRDGDDEIYVMNADGSNQIRVTDRTGNDGQSAWLSDDEIVFTSDGPISRLYVVNLFTGTERLLTLHRAGGAWPAVSPDGTRIAFAAPVNDSLQIFLCDASCDDPVQLTDQSGDNSAPSFSPDGERIVFGSTRSGNGDLYLMNVDGTGLLRLTSDTAFDFKPVFMPGN